MRTTGLWIGGEWVPGAEVVPLCNPHTGEVIAHVGWASEAQAEAAVAAAARAFPAYRALPAHRRADILLHVAEALADRREEAARLIAEEAAKPIRLARQEVDRTVQTYRFAAEVARSIYGEAIPMDATPRGEGHVALTRKEPLGVVTAITPFNFPFNLVAHKVGPALATGNTVVVKPAEQTPLSALFLAELFAAAGLPPGVLNIIPGSGARLGRVLTTDERVRCVSFTGSVRVGLAIRAQAGLRRVILELGSNSPLIIDRGFDAAELDRIAAEAAAGAFAYNGQVCISVQRIYVHQEVFARFVDGLAAHATWLQVGHPLAEETDITALINQQAADRLREWLERAVARGARVVCGGTFDGPVMMPTVLTDVPADAELNCEEAFGPVVTVAPFTAWDEAIAQANASKYGLNAGVYTKDLERAWQAAARLECGGVLINQVPTFRLDHMPYGGVKESGAGREGVRYAAEEMMETKLIAFRTGVFA
ncbi:aldehyde dehydrogenase [Alicyclobacillus cellulosilyticus]|uniref:Aldehyde dehydrogenase n=1 Tax=Alicyclobacillus cellulosilyticus TaxID=1003997 RepID=A0A917K8C1_9BACL|nr:aldehyde dehydrogenase family protein [Alicyclobacillus cellulosilyticus]GGJ01389.1 aldehyde dehydrogenase [Alicyclobacillus cellulosilyticus]